MDVLTDLLSRTHARGAFFAHVVATDRWGIAFDDGAPLGIHAVLSGEAWLTPPTGQPLRLLQGDLILLAEQGRYQLASAPDESACSLEEARARWQTRGRRIEISGEGPATSVLCGGYRFEGGLAVRLLEGLPPVIHLPGSVRASDGLRTALQLLAGELEDGSPGQQIVLDRMLDLVLIFALRVWGSEPDAAVPQWLRALDDPYIGQALLLMHEHPDHRWTVDELAHRVGLSRASFAKRFNARLGVPPLSYLTDWRLQVAADLLRSSSMPLAAIAKRVGYGSAFAFSAAFKRRYGQPPRAFRDLVDGES